MSYQVRLQQFEGPLPLLLELIEKQKLDITTVSLAQVADDFLAYIENKENVNLVNLSDFLLVASQLILIKSKALLPFFELTREEEEDIEDLEERLREYRRFKKAARHLGGMWTKQVISFAKKESVIKVIPSEMPVLNKNDLEKLVLDIIEKAERENEILEESWEDVISLEEKIIDLKNAIIQRSRISFQEAVKNSGNKTEVVVSFLAILEMLKQQIIKVKQNNNFGEIIIEKK